MGIQETICSRIVSKFEMTDAASDSDWRAWGFAARLYMSTRVYASRLLPEYASNIFRLSHMAPAA